VGADFVVGSTARRGVTVISPKDLAKRATKLAGERKKVAVLFGNEKSGLTAAELTLCDAVVRAPIAAEQPSLNLAQALQIITYELFSAALEEREAR
jgi:tRNA (cytidine32/uridine32-2'-O)-methyltransferase